MHSHAQWLFDVDSGSSKASVDGLIAVDTFDPTGHLPEEVAAIEKAKSFGAHAVFFEASRAGHAPVAQAFIFVSEDSPDDDQFGETHRRLWSWGGVPIVYRKTPGKVQLFRCVHNPEFVDKDGKIRCKAFKTLEIAAAISSDPWWDATRLRNGTLWDDPQVNELVLSTSNGAHKRLIESVKRLNEELNDHGILRKHLRRKLLILSLLIAYLEEREAFPKGFFGQFVDGATKFFEVLADGRALVDLLAKLEERFNGNVFTLADKDAELLIDNDQLAKFALLIEGRQELSGQRTLWELYSFKDLPVELISHIYQLFVTDTDTAVYTPPFLVRLMLDEALSWSQLDTLMATNEIILDPSCGSGIFLVEAYKRLVLHWRSRNDWARPNVTTLKNLLKRVHGVDREEGAVELAAFSLCLALCDALKPEELRSSIKPFPPLIGQTIHHSCFFDAKRKRLITKPVGVVVGNPPFTSKLTTPGAEASYADYVSYHGPLPDKQLAYLFLHEAMAMVAKGGILSMLQQYNFLYNQRSISFRRNFFKSWDVREVLDFISVRGLFQKADTKVIVLVARAMEAPADRKVLHATFRRSARTDAELGFDIDHYDLHWLPRELVFKNDDVWRANLLGGGRVLSFVERLRSMRTLGQFLKSKNWNFGEGFISGKAKVPKSVDHIVGQPLLPPNALTDLGVDASLMQKVPKGPIHTAYTAQRFTPPILLIRKLENFPHAIWTKGYITYKSEVVGFAAPKKELEQLVKVDEWLETEAQALRAFVAASGARPLTRKATALSLADILAFPYPEAGSLDLSDNEKHIVNDIVQYQRDLIRVGEKSDAMKLDGCDATPEFARIFAAQINTVYKKPAMKALKAYRWPGAICVPFVFGDGEVDWSDADNLRSRLDSLLYEKQGTTLRVTRIARIYDSNFMFLLKPARLRYWLPSIALRDADETLSDLRIQGF